MTFDGNLTEKLAFYARHERLLDEWIALRDEFHAAADGFFSSVLDRRVPRDAVLGRSEFQWQGRRYRQLVLTRNNWESPGDGSQPSVWFEWNDETTFVKGHLMLGVRCNPNTGPTQQAYRAALKHLRQDAGAWNIGHDKSYWRVSLDRNGLPSPAADYWKDLSGYRDDLAHFICKRWNTLAEAVDIAIGRGA